MTEQYQAKAYPYFLRSQGPFSVYDHAKSKGQQYVQNLHDTNEQAHQRFQDECQKIKERKDQDRVNFDWQKKKLDIIAAHK